MPAVAAALSRSPYTVAFRLCQFCRSNEVRGRLLWYGPRHYAHTRCFLQAKGTEALLALPPGKLQNAEARVLQEYGILDQVLARIGGDR